MNRYALSILNWQHSTNIQYAIENNQSLEDGECIPYNFFTTKSKCTKIITKVNSMEAFDVFYWRCPWSGGSDRRKRLNSFSVRRTSLGNPGESIAPRQIIGAICQIIGGKCQNYVTYCILKNEVQRLMVSFFSPNEINNIEKNCGAINPEPCRRSRWAGNPLTQTVPMSNFHAIPRLLKGHSYFSRRNSEVCINNKCYFIELVC